LHARNIQLINLGTKWEIIVKTKDKRLDGKHEVYLQAKLDYMSLPVGGR